MEKIADDFKCKICFQVLNNPVTHLLCKQVFCADCLNTILCENPNSSCPNCRSSIYPEDLSLNKILESSISNTLITCICQKQIQCSEANNHFDSCKKSQNSLNIKVLLPKEKVKNRWTFNCPSCSLKNLDRGSLVSHYSEAHPRQAAVCPICTSMPWGDPSYRSPNLSVHLKSRHKMDYDTLTVLTIQDYSMEDDEILRKVLEESKKTF
jgi:hypothetical protein